MRADFFPKIESGCCDSTITDLEPGGSCTQRNLQLGRHKIRE